MPSLNIHTLFGESKAYFISIANYDSDLITNLSTPHRDVKKVKQVLEDFHGFKCEDVKYGDNGADTSYKNPLLDPDGPTVLDFLMKVQCTPQDRIIIYFACHGIAQPSMRDPQGYFVPKNACPGEWETYVKMSDVMGIVTKLPCKHLLVILDCCFAGAFRWYDYMRGPGLDVPKTINYQRFKQYTKDDAWQVITSSAHDQQALDAIFGKRENKTDEEHEQQLSPFATLLVKALMNGEADLQYDKTPADGVITATELGFYLRNEICKYLSDCDIPVDKQQIPMLFPLRKHGKGEFVFTVPSGNGLISLDNLVEDENPYKGLLAYGIDDGKLFYGRQRVLDGWDEGTIPYQGLKEIVKQYHFIIVTGPSGIGKSSLVRAGILPLYEREKVHVMTPGKKPYTLLNDSVLSKLRSSGSGNIIFVDQFEEVITICTNASERDNFAKALLALTTNNTVIITIRSDFENHFRNSVLFTLPEDKQKRFVVPPFTREELREVVVQPALLQVLEFKAIKQGPGDNERFINRIVDEAFQSPGSLPLLSLALSELYIEKNERNLLEVKYNVFNGITGIIDKKTKDEYNRRKSEQKLFKELIYRMVAWKGSERAKRRIYTDLGTDTDRPFKNPSDGTVDELVFPDRTKTIRIKSIADRLQAARLLHTGTDENNRKYVEPAHDALLRSCSLVDDWLSEKHSTSQTTETSKIQLVRTISEVSALYHQSGKSSDYLWITDPRLAQALEIKELLNEIESKFINDSKKKRESLKKKKVHRLWIGIFSILAVAIVLFILASNYRKESRKNKALYLTSESSKYAPLEAVRLLEYAHNLHPDNQEIKRILAERFDEYDGQLSFSNKSIPLKQAIIEFIVLEDARNILIFDNDSGGALINMKGDVVIEFPRGITYNVSQNKRYFWIKQVATNRYYFYSDTGALIDSFDNKNEFASAKFTTHGNNFILTDSRSNSNVLSKIITLDLATKQIDSVVLQKPIEMEFWWPDIEYDKNTRQFIIPQEHETGTRTLLLDRHGKITHTYNGALAEFYPTEHAILIRNGNSFEYIELITQRRFVYNARNSEVLYTGIRSNDKIYFADAAKGIYEWNLKSRRLIPVDIRADFDNRKFLCVLQDTLLFFYSNANVYRLSLTTAKLDSFGLELSPNFSLYGPSISQREQMILVQERNEAFLADLLKFNYKKISSGNLSPSFLNSQGDSLLTLSPGHTQINMMSTIESFNALSWHTGKMTEEMGSLPEKDLIYVEVESEYFVINTNNNNFTKIDKKTLWLECAQHQEINRVIGSPGTIMFFGPDKRSILLNSSKLPSYASRTFYSSYHSYALIQTTDRSVYFADLKADTLTRFQAERYIQHAFLAKDTMYIFQYNQSGHMEIAVYNRHNQQPAYKRELGLNLYPPNDPRRAHFNRWYNDSTYSYAKGDSLWVKDVHNNQHAAIKFPKRIISAEYVSFNQLMISLEKEVGQDQREYIFLNKNGTILGSFQTDYLGGAVLDQKTGKIFYTDGSSVLFKYTFTGVKKRLQSDSSLLPLPKNLIDKYKL